MVNTSDLEKSANKIANDTSVCNGLDKLVKRERDIDVKKLINELNMWGNDKEVEEAEKSICSTRTIEGGLVESYDSQGRMIKLTKELCPTMVCRLYVVRDKYVGRNKYISFIPAFQMGPKGAMKFKMGDEAYDYIRTALQSVDLKTKFEAFFDGGNKIMELSYIFRIDEYRYTYCYEITAPEYTISHTYRKVATIIDGFEHGYQLTFDRGDVVRELYTCILAEANKKEADNPEGFSDIKLP